MERHKMARPTRCTQPTVQKEASLADVGRLYLRGQTQQQIADALAIHQSTVSRHLAEVRSAWLEGAKADFDEKLCRELAKIDALEAEYWAEWEDSKKSKRTVVREKREQYPEPDPDDDSEPAEAECVVTSVRNEQRNGDPRYLQGVQWCIDRRLKLLGADAPLKVAQTDPTGKEARPSGGLTDEVQAVFYERLLGVKLTRTQAVPPNA